VENRMTIVTTYTGNLSNVTTPDQIFTNLNINMGYTMGIGILVGFFFILFFALKNNTTTKNAFASSSFLVTIVAWLLWVINWISTKYFIIFITMTIVGVVILFADRE
jgi:drug/metabolite transporter (DMT)-like permease